ncbi:radical SAM protein [Thermoanaerobacterium thermosaccharolyticum]|uniref:Radical SAM protein n=1 Tax=Thermoanaerobacterium thermosaccharolyticum TaxID=1517 RepID=A0A231VK72_THETR|nr:radical SAM protein [Thermoanaerobacterium thermosaccharolyticum]OXT08620.1 radical SAM protein [Thermoanaerobacterium thermosaccharolyticum]
MNNIYIIPIFIPHLGCPHKCVFCNQDEITGFKSKIDEEYVDNTIKQYLKTIPNESHIEVSFYGGSFTGIPLEKQKKFLSIAQKYIKSGEIDAIRLSTRPDYIDEAILDNLKKYGVSIIELGVQSMDGDVLLKSLRGHTADDVCNASKLIKKYGFTLGLQMMIGLPGDNRQRSLKTADEIISLQPEFVRIYPTLVVKGTYLEKMYRNGVYNPIDLESAVELSKILYIKFKKNGIDVIRIGLQATEDINISKDVVAGPFHPAFGQLVKSSIVKDILDSIFQNNGIKDGLVDIYTNPRSTSTMVGQKKRNKIYLETKYDTEIKIIQMADIPEDSVYVGFNGQLYKDSIENYINKSTI